MLSQLQIIFNNINIYEYYEKGSSILWNTEKYMNGANIKWLPGLHSQHSPILGTAEGRIHFAGEHTSIYAGWIEGAVRSAQRVVNEIPNEKIKAKL